jgi:transcriptional regulator with XRE-family HTH domain/quercetin dioxygenase-like cupin family protein
VHLATGDSVKTDQARPSHDAESVVQLGLRLRQARQRSGLSLRALARELGVSASFVSQLENGKSQPSVATLFSLAQLLGVSIDELFDHGAAEATAHPGDAEAQVAAPDAVDSSSHVDVATGTDGDVALPTFSRAGIAAPADAWSAEPTARRLSRTAPGNRPRLVMDTGVIWEQLAETSDHNLEFIEVVYPPGSSSTNDDRMLRHDGYDYGYLLEGELELTLGFEVHMLRAGDAVGFESAVPHRLKNLGSEPARSIWVVHNRH